MGDENQFDDESKSLKVWIAVSIVAAIILALAFFPGRSIYRHFKEKHGVAQARVFFAKGDYRNALLSARQAWLLNTNNVEACFIMAELDDAAHSPATLDWCQRLVKLSPAISNKLLLASAGLRYQSPPFPLLARCSTICPRPPLVCRISTSFPRNWIWDCIVWRMRKPILKRRASWCRPTGCSD